MRHHADMVACRGWHTQVLPASAPDSLYKPGALHKPLWDWDNGVANKHSRRHLEVSV